MARIIGKGFSYDDVLIVPKYNTISSRKEVSFRTKVTRNHYIDIPIVAANMDTVCESNMAITIGKMGGLGVIHRFLSIKEQVEEVKKVKKEKLLSGAAIGVKDYEKRVPELKKAGVDILVLDIACGHSKMATNALRYLKQNFPEIDVMVGNIASKQAAEDFLKRGADAIKIGIGPGSMCTTRIMTGVGVPQITAILDAYSSTNSSIPICADGGIKYPGDIAKAIGAGADTVMIGSVISGTLESPGEILEIECKKFKEYRGMASLDATIKKVELDGKKEEVFHIEGERTLVDYKGSVVNIIKKYLGGLASGMTYVNAKNIEEIKAKVDFIEITSSGLNESHAHGVNK